MKKLIEEEAKQVAGGVYDVKKYGFFSGNCWGAKCGYCGCEYISNFGATGIFGRQAAIEKAYSCEIEDAWYWERFNWAPAGYIGRV